MEGTASLKPAHLAARPGSGGDYFVLSDTSHRHHFFNP